jgi:hypothetical protein
VTTALALIRHSLRKIGVIDPAETLSAEEAQDGLESLNAMLSTWRLEGLMAYDVERAVFAITADTQTYSLGPSGTWNTTPIFGSNATRPVKIDHMGLIDTTQDPDLEVPMEEMSHAEYQDLRLKDLGSTWPTRWQYSASVPLGSVYLWPKPTVNRSAAVYLQRQLHRFTTVQTDVVLADGYEEAIVNNLAIRLCPEYGRGAGPEIIDVAKSSKALIRRNNREPVVLQLDPLAPGQRSVGRWNYITGQTE